jgi:C4-dicarboxylate-specific signal transduction histidine kinase
MTPTAETIRAKLAKRDRLERELREADADLIAAGRLYWADQGLCAFPRVDALRRAVGER